MIIIDQPSVAIQVSDFLGSQNFWLTRIQTVPRRPFRSKQMIRARSIPRQNWLLISSEPKSLRKWSEKQSERISTWKQKSSTRQLKFIVQDKSDHWPVDSILIISMSRSVHLTDLWPPEPIPRNQLSVVSCQKTWKPIEKSEGQWGRILNKTQPIALARVQKNIIHCYKKRRKKIIRSSLLQIKKYTRVFMFRKIFDTCNCSKLTKDEYYKFL